MNSVVAGRDVPNRELPVLCAHREVRILEHTDVTDCSQVRAGIGINRDFGSIEPIEDRGFSWRNGSGQVGSPLSDEMKVVIFATVVTHPQLLTDT